MKERQNINRLNMCIGVMRIATIILVVTCSLSCYDTHKSSTREAEQKIERMRSMYLKEGVRVYFPIEINKNDVPLISVFSFPDGVPRYDLAFVLWSNGRLIWSQTKLKNEANVLMFGGPPYRETYIFEKRVEKMLYEFEKVGIFADPYYNNEEASLNPDANYQMISIIHGQKAVCLVTPFIPNDQKLKLLDGLTPSDKRRFQIYWQIKEIIKSFIPSEGKIVDFKYEISNSLAHLSKTGVGG